MRVRIRWHRLPAPVFLIICLVWLTWSVISLVCRVWIWALLKLIRLTQSANRKLSQRRAPIADSPIPFTGSVADVVLAGARGKQRVCVTRPTDAPPRKPAILVREDERVPVATVDRKPVVKDEAYIERRKRLMLALGIKHEDIADGLLAKGYPVGW